MGDSAVKDWRDSISFVLVNPSEPGNIGASARAVKNMGFNNLILVNPPENFIEGRDFWLACHATDLLEEAGVFKSLDDAISDKALVVGTSRRTGKKRGLLLPLEEAIKEIRKRATKNRVAILFGREDRGLTNEEAGECGFLVNIPTSEEAPSLNLAQSVLIVAYELTKGEMNTETPAFVPHEELPALFEHIGKTLDILGYFPRGDRDMEVRIMRNLKHMLGRSGLTPWEAGMLHGICSRIERKIKG
ncbi:putative tRNA/rRNA methyltransferase [bacterium BMS3Bbin06]|nr:putative tRNA/rRNA methyltransferase [bacterium BMS3Abin08]GBE33566.1 putative tRNA/rRNA methyltransferase [bacterium BMS3Bbin06]HDO35343.1 RNA methyltransferase [Nitrospirota bacterium]HDY70617.1 RNA methyltransferase [Nitrospirota bacterium]